MAEHIDENKIHSDVHYRFEYLSKFINFTSEDIKILNEFATHIVPLIPVISDSVYRKLFQYDITKNYFIINNENFDGSSTKTENLSLESAQMVYRRDMLSGYLKRLFLQGEWTKDFLEYLSKVGKMHTNKVGSASINVDFIHISTTLTFIENILIENISSNETFDLNRKKQILLSINKVFKIQSDLFLMHYLEPLKNTTTTTSTNHKKDNCICS